MGSLQPSLAPGRKTPGWADRANQSCIDLGTATGGEDGRTVAGAGVAGAAGDRAGMLGAAGGGSGSTEGVPVGLSSSLCGGLNRVKGGLPGGG